MSGPARWRMRLGPANVLISTPLPLGAAVTAMRSRGEPPMYELIPALDTEPGGHPAASVVHAAAGPPGAVWDSRQASLMVSAADGQTTADGLLYLAYLVLESQLQRAGYVTLHAAAASWADRGVLLLGSAGAGKTTTLLRLCRDHGAAMVGNDLVVTGGTGDEPEAVAGTRHLRLRHSSVARAMPDLLGLFPGEVTDSWRAKRSLDRALEGIDGHSACAGCPPGALPPP